jgi:aminoglycoside 2'-N-acetyltransferase I
MDFRVVSSAQLTAAQRTAILDVCRAAYEEEVEPFFADIGPGLHVMGEAHGTLVTHALLVDRWLETPGHAPMRTAYVELVATHPEWQGRGYASQLLRSLVPHMPPCVIGALSPSDPVFYERLGWELWRGPLAVRTASGLEPSPSDEQVMVLRLPETPAGLDLDAPLSIEWRPGEAW